MDSNDRTIEIMADLLEEIRHMRKDTNERLDKTNERLDKTNERLDKTNERLGSTNERLDTANNRLDRLETQMSKNTAAVGELRLSVMKLADKMEDIHKLDQRLRVVENIVLPKSPLQAA